MAKKPSKSQGDVTDIQDLVNTVELRAVRCHELSAKILEDIDIDEMLQLSAEAQYRVGFRIAPGNGSFDIRITCTVDGNRNNAPNAPPVVRIVATFELRYALLNPAVAVTPERVGAFAERNGTFNAWPFLREGIHSACVRLGVSPVTLGLLRIKDQSRDPVAATK